MGYVFVIGIPPDKVYRVKRMRIELDHLEYDLKEGKLNINFVLITCSPEIAYK